MHQNKPFRLFLLLAGFFIANALIAEFVGVKIFSLEKTLNLDPFSFSFFGKENLGFNLTAGVVLWPVIFVMTDVINEYFGMRSVKLLSYLTVGLVIYAFIMVYFTIGLEPNDWWQFESGKLAEESNKHISRKDISKRFRNRREDRCSAGRSRSICRKGWLARRSRRIMHRSLSPMHRSVNML